MTVAGRAHCRSISGEMHSGFAALRALSKVAVPDNQTEGWEGGPS